MGDKSFLRAGHGQGSGRPHVEAPPADELSSPTGGPAPSRGRPFQKGNKAAAARKPTLATLAGIRYDLADEDYARCLRLAENYRRRRASEIVTAHGWLSSGAAGMLATSAMQLALSKLYAARAGQDPAAAALASRLGNDSRQNELAAWELAAREAQARPKAPPAWWTAPRPTPPVQIPMGYGPGEEHDGEPWPQAPEAPKPDPAP